MAGQKDSNEAGNKDGGKETGKEMGKESRDKAKKSKDDSGALLRRLADEMTALRADLDLLKGAEAASLPDTPYPPRRKRGGDSGEIAPLRDSLLSRLAADKDAALAFAYAYRATGSDDTTVGASDALVHTGLEGILAADDNRVARLGYALGSAPKVALVRALLWDGPQSAAQLGEKAGLTTGSLYHHLRELSHAEVIEQAGRNRFALTEIGRQTALFLFVQASR